MPLRSLLSQKVQIAFCLAVRSGVHGYTRDLPAPVVPRRSLTSEPGVFFSESSAGAKYMQETRKEERDLNEVGIWGEPGRAPRLGLVLRPLREAWAVPLLCTCACVLLASRFS